MAATGRSISFSPDTLYETAKDWGADQDTKLNPSQVVCVALKEFFEKRGVSIDPATPGAEADLMVEVRELSRTVGVPAIKAKLAELSLAVADTAGEDRR